MLYDEIDIILNLLIIFLLINRMITYSIFHIKTLRKSTIVFSILMIMNNLFLNVNEILKFVPFNLFLTTETYQLKTNHMFHIISIYIL